MDPKEKIFRLAELEVICNELRDQGRTIVLCLSQFDRIHPWVVNFLYRAHALTHDSGELLVGILSDAHTHGGHNSESSRAYAIAGLTSVSFVTIFENEIPTIEVLQPHIYAFWGTLSSPIKDAVGRVGAELHHLPLIHSPG